MNRADLPDNEHLTTDLVTCIGNKRSLIPFIDSAIRSVKARLNKHKLDTLDMFSGSGVVSRLLKEHSRKLTANDFEDYSEAINKCYLTNHSHFDWRTYEECREFLMARIKCDWRTGLIAQNYAPADDNNIKRGERVFYTRRNAEFIDTARQHIGELPANMQNYFLSPLIVRASIHNNTGGVFKGFYKNRKGVGAFGGTGGHALKRILGDVEIPRPLFSPFECCVRVTKHDALELAGRERSQYDLAYLDPPYNQHPYGSNYFMLNLILHYEKPDCTSKVSGIPTGWKRSPFNKPQSASEAFFGVVDSLDARFLLISYSSEGFIQLNEMLSELRMRGKLTFLETPYNTYRGCRNLSRRSPYVNEYLFLLEKKYVEKTPARSRLTMPKQLPTHPPEYVRGRIAPGSHTCHMSCQ